jgi:hypothetical protein
MSVIAAGCSEIAMLPEYAWMDRSVEPGAPTAQLRAMLLPAPVRQGAGVR